MANIAAKTNANVSCEARCETATHIGLEALTMILGRNGIYASTDIKKVKSFIRTKFPGLSLEEEESLIKNNVFHVNLLKGGE